LASVASFDRIGKTVLPSSISPTFVGRQPELRSLHAGLDASLQGSGRVFILSGDAGIGKTRLAGELSHYARAHGAAAIWGVCHEDRGAPPFWPWVQIIRSLVHDQPADISGPDWAAFGPDLVQLAPDLRELVPSASPLPTLQPDQARFRLFDAVSTLLRRVAARRPLLLLLDDLHWADKPSLLLLEFLARELGSAPLMVVICYREFEVPLQHPLAQTLGFLIRRPGSERLTLRGLTVPEVLQLLEEVTGSAHDQATASKIHGDTGGNPLFIGEMVRLMSEDAGAGGWGGQVLPRGVRDVISRRLQGLSSSCLAALEVAAVLGRDFTLPVLSQVAGRPVPDLIASLDEAEQAHVLVGGAQPGHFTFAHALIQQSLHDSLTSARRMQLHRDAGEVLEASPGVHGRLPELAYHFVRAAPHAGAIKAAHYARRAGQEELATLAFEQASEHFQEALQVLRGDPASSRQPELELLLLLGEAQSRAGERLTAKETFLQAAAMARDLGSASHLGEAALGFAGVWVTAGSLDEALARLLREALAAIEEQDASLQARLLVRLAQELYYSGDEAAVAALTAQAVEIAHQGGDSRALAAALNGRHQTLRRPQDLPERLAVAGEIVRLAEAAGDDELALQGHHWRLVDLVEAGDPAGIEAEQASCLRLAERLRQPYHLWWAAVPQATIAMLRGEFGRAEELARSALASGQRANEPSAGPFFQAQLFALQLDGLLPPATDVLANLADRFPSIPVWRAALAWQQAELGELGLARDAFDRLFDGDRPLLPRDGNETIGLACLAAACSALGDKARAASLYSALLPYRDRNVHTSRLSACFGPAGLFLGQLAWLLGRERDARAHFEDAATLSRRIGAWPWLARAQFEHARLLAALPDAPNSAAEALLAEARSLAHRCGMVRLAARISATAQVAPVRLPAGLTARESEILRLLAGGSTSQEIAERLIVSVHTVNRHIANIYAKIGARGRAEATAFAFRSGLV
jgi:DNA-binding CsgD family transcriptional regulator/tetratricopeptide (TPR) repeat protein